jgi:dihydrofolate reductase
MADLLIDFITSLDGYAAADGWPGWWGLEGPEYLAWLGEQPEADYAVLMGAATYRLMPGFAARGEPGTGRCPGGPVEGRLPGRTRSSWLKTPLRPCGR